eukprot:3507052-Rhodomonas_salina.1
MSEDIGRYMVGENARYMLEHIAWNMIEDHARHHQRSAAAARCQALTIPDEEAAMAWLAVVFPRRQREQLPVLARFPHGKAAGAVLQSPRHQLHQQVSP